MNWTEGSLARHSRRKGWNEEAARQKEYFAKARARQRQSPAAAPKAASFVPSYIPTRQNHGHQAKLDRLTAVQPGKSARKRLLHLRNEPDGGIHEGGQLLSSPQRQAGPRGQDNGSDPVDLGSKRQRLLLKHDWAGIELQKPLPVDSMWQETGHRHDHTQQRDHLQDGMSPRARKLRQTAMQLVSPRSQASLRLRIGSQDFRWSRESNSVRSPASHKSRVPSLLRHKSRYHLSSSPTTAHQARVSSRSASHRPTENIDSPRHLGRSLSTQLSLDSVSTSISERHSHLSAASASPIVETGDAQCVVMSSPAAIHHPIPARNSLQIFLESVASNEITGEAGSVVAQVGAPQRTANRLVKADQIWRRWLNNEEDSRNLKAAPSTHPSPGISHYWANSTDTSSLVEIDNDNEEPINGVSNPKQLAAHIPMRTDLHERLPYTRPAENSVPTKESQCKPTRQSAAEDPNSGATSNPVLSVEKDLLKAPNVKDLMEILEQEDQIQKAGRESTSPPECLDSEDEDEIWKKFVFDEDPSEINRRAIDEALGQTRRQLRQAVEALASDVAEPPSTGDMEETRAQRVETSMASSDALGHISPSECLTFIESEDAANTSTAAQPPSPRPKQTDFRFSAPQTFVGRLASLLPNDDGSTGHAVPLVRRGRGRPKKRDHGRPDIRALPNFEGDPIEEED